MKKYFLLSFILIYCLSARSQSLKKYPVANSGCSVYAFCELVFEKEYSSDSSEVYTAECKKDDVGYGVICVKLLSPLTDPDKAEEVMIDYLDYLKTAFKISKAAGYGRGHRLKDNENTRGVLDYW